MIGCLFACLFVGTGRRRHCGDHPHDIKLLLFSSSRGRGRGTGTKKGDVHATHSLAHLPHRVIFLVVVSCSNVSPSVQSTPTTATTTTTTTTTTIHPLLQLLGRKGYRDRQKGHVIGDSTRTRHHHVHVCVYGKWADCPSIGLAAPVATRMHVCLCTFPSCGCALPRFLPWTGIATRTRPTKKKRKENKLQRKNERKKTCREMPGLGQPTFFHFASRIVARAPSPHLLLRCFLFCSLLHFAVRGLDASSAGLLSSLAVLLPPSLSSDGPRDMFEVGRVHRPFLLVLSSCQKNASTMGDRPSRWWPSSCPNYNRLFAIVALLLFFFFRLDVIMLRSDGRMYP